MSRHNNEEEDEYELALEHSGRDDSSLAAGSGNDNESLSAYSNAKKGDVGNDGDGIVSKRDQSVVNWTRFCFLITLLGAAVAMTLTVFYTLRNGQIEDFETHFESLANEIVEVSNEHVQGVFGVMAGLATTATSFVKMEHEANPQYPKGFMTFPNVENHFGTARNASGALVLAYLPMVAPTDMELWSNYSTEKQKWILESNGLSDSSHMEPIFPEIWDYADERRRLAMETCGAEARRHLAADEEEEISRQTYLPEDGPFAPVWTFSPAPPADDTHIINYNLIDKSVFKKAVDFMEFTRKPTFLDVCNQAAWFGNPNHADILQTVIAYPVFGDFGPESDIVGHLIQIIPWKRFFEYILSDPENKVHVVLENTCDEVFTFEVSGSVATLLSEEDVHEKKFDNLVIRDIFAEFANPKELNDAGLDEVCVYTMSVYPTQTLEDLYRSNEPVLFATVVLGVFLLTSLLFLLFDCMVQRQQSKVVSTALRQNAIVSSLFPKKVQEQMLAEVDAKNRASNTGKAGIKSYLFDVQSKEKSSANEGAEKGGPSDKSKPIADLFPETTIMFADIAGFTAWSSTREPSAVFTLLETIYHKFDSLAKRRRVFKVEVVGDCYVAVCGLPDPRMDHFVVMTKFASECVREMDKITKRLDSELGPDTSELKLRAGLHSGPVVAGVLRGEKSRFQLFGDTMNTAARMESTGIPGRVQISQDTFDLLSMAGKSHWCIQREEKVQAKGKGELTTYFIKSADDMRSSRHRTYSDCGSDVSVGSRSAASLYSMIQDQEEEVERALRMADWMTDVLATLLRDIEVRRRAAGTKRDSASKMRKLEIKLFRSSREANVIEEVKEIIELPDFDAKAHINESGMDPKSIKLEPEVYDELKEFIRAIAVKYNKNPFHNFQHANHVTMSVVKLLSRIVAPDHQDVKTNLHDHTYGITSDPLTRFAVVLSGLIHDVDHQGVPNTTLVNEETTVAASYNNKSVAEQNSIDISWELLMEDRFTKLRRHIYTTESEFYRFRNLVVNTVLATDLMDKDLKDLRNRRWADAFFDGKNNDGVPRTITTSSSSSSSNDRVDINRKATIVIEHLIQASDVAHTMQHWKIYRKWNEKLFEEMYFAWDAKRLGGDPSVQWYENEIKFFDFYVIPLAKKLKECGVFGVSSDEYLSYAMQNRKEWEEKGRQVSHEMLNHAKDKLERRKRREAKKQQEQQEDDASDSDEESVNDVASPIGKDVTTGSTGGTTDSSSSSAE